MYSRYDLNSTGSLWQSVSAHVLSAELCSEDHRQQGCGRVYSPSQLHVTGQLETIDGVKAHIFTDIMQAGPAFVPVAPRTGRDAHASRQPGGLSACVRICQNVRSSAVVSLWDIFVIQHGY